MSGVMDQFKLDDKAAVITGGSRGLGLGIARALLEAGAKVLLVSRTEEELNEAARRLDPDGLGKALPCRGDLTRLEDIDRMMETCLGRFGRLDILVNSAGTTVRKPAVEYTEQDWDRVLDLNLKSAFFASIRAARAMIDSGRGGKILHIASLASARGLPTNVPAYTASKGGLARLVQALAGEWAPHNIRVNAIGPGYMKTKLTEPILSKPDVSERLLARIPLGRFGLPRDLAGAAVFLCSPASDYVTGQVLYVDGGYLTR